MHPTIRPAGMPDLLAIQRLVYAAYEKYVVRIGREPAPMLEDYATHITDARIWVIGTPDALQGVVSLLLHDGDFTVDVVAVSPENQGKGLGRVLLDFADAQALAAGFKEIKLYTNEAMTENLSLYAHLGYRETHRALDQGYRRVFMCKPLTASNPA